MATSCFISPKKAPEEGRHESMPHFHSETPCPNVEGWRRATWFLGVWKECEQIGVSRRSASRYVVDCVRRNWSVLGQGSPEIASTKRGRQGIRAGNAR